MAFPPSFGSSDAFTADLLLDIGEGVSGYRSPHAQPQPISGLHSTTGGLQVLFADKSLQVYRLIAPNGRPVEAPDSVHAFLQVDHWKHPLTPGKSPVLRAKRRFYVFPEVETVEEDVWAASQSTAKAAADGASSGRLADWSVSAVNSAALRQAAEAVASHATSVILSMSVPDAEVDVFESLLIEYADMRATGESAADPLSQSGADDDWMVLDDAIDELVFETNGNATDHATQHESVTSAGRRAASSIYMTTTSVVTATSEFVRDAYTAYQIGDWASIGVDTEQLVLDTPAVTCYRVLEGNAVEPLHKGSMQLVDREYSAWIRMGEIIVPLGSIKRMEHVSARSVKLTTDSKQGTMLMVFGEASAKAMGEVQLDACTMFASALQSLAAVERPTLNDRLSKVG
eukprot:Opistho-2@96127